LETIDLLGAAIECTVEKFGSGFEIKMSEVEENA